MHLSQEARDFGFCRLELGDACDPLRLARTVAQNVPVVFRNALLPCAALQLWDRDYLCAALGDAPVSVSQTPDGRADALVDGKFCLPETREMSMSAFFKACDTDVHAVYYIQSQNSNLHAEFAPLLPDLPRVPDIARHIFPTHNQNPDATNIWIGGSRSVTSLHKDHYDNLYTVIRGKKTFSLYPPTDFAHLCERRCGVHQYHRLGPDSAQWELVDMCESTHWVSASISEIPVPPIVVSLEPGDILFLPSLWYHQVEQEDDTIAVNWWFDMAFDDARYAYFSFLRRHCLESDKDTPSHCLKSDE
ncbi:MAG: hypothetical protein SGCHY_004203 [Lobulomycetales sp.]